MKPHLSPSQTRTFADVRPDVPPLDDLAWPTTTAAQLPTPYEIFCLQKGAPYNKQRFYELVKIYHPDKHHCASSHFPPLSHATKLERYRLIIAANAILSCPTARRAYDRHGLGWGASESSLHSYRQAKYTQSSSSYQNPWSGFADNASPFRNATWEDWEKWHHHHQTHSSHSSSQPHRKSKQRPHFFSNGGFVAVIILCSVLGGMGEISRARQFSGSFLEQLEDVHGRSSRDLERRRRESAVAGREERVRRFMEGREPRWAGRGRDDEREEVWGGGERGLLAEPEVRASGEAGA